MNQQPSDALIHDALKHWHTSIVESGNDFDRMKSTLTASIPHLPLGFEVKQLEWERTPAGNYQANSELGTYTVRPDSWTESRKESLRIYGSEKETQHSSIIEAQAAAQADFESRVLSCGTLTNEATKPVDVAAVYREALERISRFDRSHGSWETIAYDAINNIAGRALSAEPAQHPDDTAVDNFATHMKAKLAQKREEGRSGWQGMNADELTIILRKHVDKGDPIDVANLCMMLSENGQCIAPAEPAQGEQWRPTHRHVKRGTEYQLIGIGIFQAGNWKIQYETIGYKDADMQQVAIYRGEGRQLWARPILEFNDGRFEPLPAALHRRQGHEADESAN